MSGMYLVTVPIGNEKDITLRALETLNECEYVFAEDTRVFKSLCQRLNINLENKNIDSFHDHSGDLKLRRMFDLAKNKKVAFVSDAGSPVISDPAFPIILKAHEEDLKIHSISGISAVNTALELSGLAPTPFHFHGFIARETSKKNELYSDISSQYGTHIFFEGVSRVKKTLSELSALLEDYDIVVARELTKDYESIYRFKGSAYKDIAENIVEKGEFVILVNNPLKKIKADHKAIELAQEIIKKGAKPKLLSKLLSQVTGESSKELYEKMKRD